MLIVVFIVLTHQGLSIALGLAANEFVKLSFVEVFQHHRREEHHRDVNEESFVHDGRSGCRGGRVVGTIVIRRVWTIVIEFQVGVVAER